MKSKATFLDGSIILTLSLGVAWLPRATADVAGTLKATPQAADRRKTAKLAHAREVTINGSKLAFGR
jgi:hypothetical protein